MANGETLPDCFFTIQQASDFTTLKVPTLRLGTQKGEIPYIRVGRRVLFSRNALIDFLKQREIPVKNLD